MKTVELMSSFYPALIFSVQLRLMSTMLGQEFSSLYPYYHQHLTAISLMEGISSLFFYQLYDPKRVIEHLLLHFIIYKIWKTIVCYSKFFLLGLYKLNELSYLKCLEPGL